jgi:hypothetical protein
MDYICLTKYCINDECSLSIRFSVSLFFSAVFLGVLATLYKISIHSSESFTSGKI